MVLIIVDAGKVMNTVILRVSAQQGVLASGAWPEVVKVLLSVSRACLELLLLGAASRTATAWYAFPACVAGSVSPMVDAATWRELPRRRP